MDPRAFVERARERERAGRSAAIAAALAFAACSDPPPAPGPGVVCEAYDPACVPIVSPVTFDALYTNVLKPSCAGTPGTCHTERAAGGLDLSTVDRAHANLQSRRTDGDVPCSELWSRVASKDATRRMPPGASLSDAQRCAIGKWLEAGGPR